MNISLTSKSNEELLDLFHQACFYGYSASHQEIRSELARRMTAQSRTNERIHVLPLGGTEPLHFADSDCWCFPLAQVGSRLVIHNAKDTREKLERQGISDRARPWCTVLEKF